MRSWKKTVGLVAAAFTLSAGSAAAAAESHILLNYHDHGMGSTQVVAEGTTLVPLKSLAEGIIHCPGTRQPSQPSWFARTARSASPPAPNRPR